jgi:translation initiation factor IF-1
MNPDKKEVKKAIKKVFSQIMFEIELEKGNNMLGSFNSSVTDKNVRSGDLKIEKLSRNNSVPTIYD